MLNHKISSNGQKKLGLHRVASVDDLSAFLKSAMIHDAEKTSVKNSSAGANQKDSSKMVQTHEKIEDDEELIQDGFEIINEIDPNEPPMKKSKIEDGEADQESTSSFMELDESYDSFDMHVTPNSEEKNKEGH
ncbi:unnamed protein product [Caenorhabditis sp. 36 PRJEB53466]|nr:unnamed protein product [Caenorhabditis sp. 36 PRJEB53466]